MSTFSRIAVCGLALAATSLSALAQTSAGPQHIPSCRSFAQGFYTWYVPLTQKDTNRPAFYVALRSKAAVFSPELLRALRNDSKAQARANGDLVGIDFDPFVGGQDPADHYAVRQVTITGNKCFAEVWRDPPTPTPERVSETGSGGRTLALHAGHWEFVNFRYPNVDSDLMGVLTLLRRDREAPRSDK